MNKLATSVSIIVLTAGIASGDEIDPVQIVSSLGLAVGAAQGMTEEELTMEIGAFPNVSEFESRRMVLGAVNDAVVAGKSIVADGYPRVTFDFTNQPLSEFDFKNAAFSTCFPVRTAESIPQDVPIPDGMEMKIALPDGYRGGRVNCPGRMQASELQFIGKPMLLPMPNDGVAEEIHNQVRNSGGQISFRVRCVLGELDYKVYGSYLICPLEEVQVSASNINFDEAKVFYKLYWDYDNSAYKHEVVNR